MKSIHNTNDVIALRYLHNSINRTRLLAESTVYTFSHVNIISRCPPTSICSCFCFNGYSLSRAYGFTELARNTPFFTVRVSPEGMFTTETRTYGTLFERVVESNRLAEECTESCS